MRTRPSVSSLTCALLPLLLAACDGGGGTGADMTPAALKWYATCGDPVCGGHRDTGVPRCTTEMAGQACATAGQQCDPVNDCNSLLRCTDKDPKQQPGGCPISRRRFKADVRYLTPEDLARYHEELRGVRLATYRYRDAAPGAPRRLGFMLDEHEASAAADPERDMVDLYGYTSMAVAALQVQARKIEELEQEVARLRQQLARRRR